MEELDSYISEAISQLSSSKKQPKEKAIYNLLSKKLDKITIYKEQLTEKLNCLHKIKSLQNNPRNDVDSFNIIIMKVKVLNCISCKLFRIRNNKRFF